MIIKNVKVIDGKIFYYYYSDQKMIIEKDGIRYKTAYCIAETDFQETDEPIEEREEEEE